MLLVGMPIKEAVVLLRKQKIVAKETDLGDVDTPRDIIEDKIYEIRTRGVSWSHTMKQSPHRHTAR